MTGLPMARRGLPVALALLLCAAVGRAGLPDEAPQADATPRAASAETLAQHAGKAGLYLRLPEGQREGNPEFFLSHPLVDAVWVSFKWSELEPRPGEFDFTAIDRTLELCKKFKKGLVLGLTTYGQFADEEKQPTPAWLYENGVKQIVFEGRKDKEIVIPKVWEGPCLDAYAKFIGKVAEKYKDETALWYLRPGFGHLGNLNAQPRGDGGQALQKEGWTPELWQDYCFQVTGLYQKAFPNTPLIVGAAGQLLKDKEHDKYKKEMLAILVGLAERGVSVTRGGLEANVEKLKKNRVLEEFAPLAPFAEKGLIRLGISDDWPLWVPPERRQQKFLSDRDEQGLERILNYAFGGVDGLPRSLVSIIKVLHPEVKASHPQNKEGQNKIVFELLSKARERLKAEDPCTARPVK